MQSQLGHILCAGLQETCSSIASHTFGILYASEKERQTHAYTLSHNYIPTSSHIDTSNCKQGDGDGEIPKGAGSLSFCVCVGGGGEEAGRRKTNAYLLIGIQSDGLGSGLLQNIPILQQRRQN